MIADDVVDLIKTLIECPQNVEMQAKFMPHIY